jgi:hypothetical protein
MRSCDRLQLCRHRSNCTLKGIIDHRSVQYWKERLRKSVVVVVKSIVGGAESAHRPFAPLRDPLQKSLIVTFSPPIIVMLFPPVWVP